MTIIVLATISVTACYADDARQIYQAMKGLEGDWVLSPANAQEGNSLLCEAKPARDVGRFFKHCK